jgi:NAD(P)-dependent dehydrogenase (short-subunit alcohol dehydrogenase family)
MSQKKVCVVVGVGPGNGAAFARRFASAGYAVALLARRTDLSAKLASELPGARAYACDVSDEASVKNAFASIAKDLGDPDVVVYNAGSGTFGTVEDIDAKALEDAFRVNVTGLFLCARQVIAKMKERGSGNIVVVGATASRRGVPRTAAFAPAKAAQKSLAESMARHLGPSKIHVSLIVVDGVVNLTRTREMMKDKPDDFFIQPADVAEAAYQLTEQKPSSWSFEIDVRPYGEKW